LKVVSAFAVAAITAPAPAIMSMLIFVMEKPSERNSESTPFDVETDRARRSNTMPSTPTTIAER
jgi:hypothetical protein